MAALAEAHARLTERAEWYLPEKDLLERADLATYSRCSERSAPTLVVAVALVRDCLRLP